MTPELRRRPHDHAGFSLVELSVVLMIISITLASALDLSINYTESENIKKTQKRFSRISRAFEDFLLTEKRLPCPAKAEERVSESNFGRGGTPSGGGGCPFAANASGMALGVPPVRDLGLSDEDLLDGWGRRIEYAVDLTFVQNETTNGACASNKKCYFYATDGTINIQNTDGALIAADATYVLLSHGNNGLGGYNAYGAEGPSKGRLADPPASHTFERENAEPPAGSSAPADKNFVQGDRTADFDDILTYRPKWHISGDAKSLEADEWSTCQSAFDPVKACEGIADPPGSYACEEMAKATARFCLDFNG